MNRNRHGIRARRPLAGAAVVTLLLSLYVVLGTAKPAEAAQTNVRPIQDFLNAQTLPIDLVDWISNATQKDPVYRTRIDFTGIIHSQFVVPNGASFGTEFSGQVTERVLPDGRTEVQVVLRGKNVFYTVVSQNPPFAQTYSGRLAGAAVFNGLPIDTCDTLFELTYVTTNAPGSPLTGLGQLFFNTPANWEVLQSRLIASGDATLRPAFGVPDGTRGRFSLNMTGLVKPKGGSISADETFPIARIDLVAVGD